MKVNLIRWPDQHDWDRCKLLALGTEGKEAKTSATAEWKHKMLKCEHSPIRTLMFTIQLVDVPYWVSVHYVRHKYGIEHYVRSQRNDRQSQYDRNSAPQNAPVNHIIEVNAQELMFMARKRLCSKAAEETKQVMEMIVEAVVKVCPEFKPFLVPQCEYLGRCPEIYGCGMFDDNHLETVNGITGNEYQKLAMRTKNVNATERLQDKIDMCQFFKEADGKVRGRKDFGGIINACFGLSGEVGEFNDMIKKWIFHEKELDEVHAKKECGDILWYISMLCESFGWSMEEIMQMNIDKLKARYPDGFDVAKSEHRAEGDV